MKNYEVIEQDFDSVIKATEGEKVLWIPMELSNKHYQEYLRYTEWVEAGNNPEDFWTQDEL